MTVEESAELRRLITEVRGDIRDWRAEIRSELDNRVRLDLYRAEISNLQQDVHDLSSARRAAVPLGVQVAGVLVAIGALAVAIVTALVK